MPNQNTVIAATFAVDEVSPATKPLPEIRSHEALKQTLGSTFESCCDYHGTVIKHAHYQPLLAAVYTAFNDHRPLVLTPDSVWITITQGVAHHMAIHGERLRSRFVSHQGKLDLVFRQRDWVGGSPENPWPEAFASWTEQIRDHVGDRIYQGMICDFSTSGPVERAASQIVMMDIFERYFHYMLCGICGIPSITLEGTPDDWQHLRDKAAGLDVFDLDWWLADLLPICDQFARASRGDVDLDHWQGLCKLRKSYGGHIINGWVARLFPYLRSFVGGPCNRRNPIFETGEGFQTFYAPTGLSSVPFRWIDQVTGRERLMEAIGGLLGVAQDSQTLALRPKVGWAVREAEGFDVLLASVAAGHVTFSGRKVAGRSAFPPDLSRFYHRTDGAELHHQTAAACRIVPADQVEPLDWGELPDEYSDSRGPDGRIWHRFAWFADGRWLAINLDPNRRDPRPREGQAFSHDPNFAAICFGGPDTTGRPGRNPVVALSFSEFLGRLLDQGPTPYWLEPQFTNYGDAEEYTRRDT